MSNDLDRLDEVADAGPGDGRPPVLRALIDGAHDGGNGASREEAGEFIVSWAARHGFKSTEKAMDALAEAQERFCPEQPAVASTGDVTKSYVGLIKVLDYLALHPDAISFYCVCKAPNISILNDNPAVQHMSMAQKARQLGVSKEAVRKRMEHVQQHFGYPPLPEQRSATSCKKMSVKRISQLRQPAAGQQKKKV